MSATFFLSSSWFINQEKDKKQSMRETWVQSYFSPLHCLSSSLILKRVESGVVYLPLSKISKLQFMTLTFLDILLRNKASLGKISKLTVQTFTISDNSLTSWEFKSSAKKITKFLICRPFDPLHMITFGRSTRVWNFYKKYTMGWNSFFLNNKNV